MNINSQTLCVCWGNKDQVEEFDRDHVSVTFLLLWQKKKWNKTNKDKEDPMQTT